MTHRDALASKWPILGGRAFLVSLIRGASAGLTRPRLGAGLLGHPLAYRAGKDYESLIANRITQALNMPDTCITLSDSMEQRMATGHNGMLTPAANWDLPTLAGAGALRSSANDMLDVRRPLGQSTIGLGWILVSAHDRDIAGHDGGTGGFCSWIGYDPEERVGVVVLSNASTAIGVLDIGIHLLDQEWPLANPEPPKQRTEIQIDPRFLDNYTGLCQLAPHLIFEVTRGGDRLFGQTFAQSTAGPKFEVFAESEKKFFARVSNNQITFETDPEGRATSLTLHKAGRDMPAARLS